MFKEDIENLTKKNFKLTGVPVWLIKDFKEYCRNECGDMYAVGLLQLWKTKQAYEDIIPLLSNVLQELESLKAQLNSGTRRPTTFEDVEDS